MATLSVNIFETPEAVVIRLEGEGRFQEADRLQIPFQRVVTGRPRLVVLDLAGLTFAASLFLGQLVSLRRGVLLHGGRVKIAAAQENIREVLQVSRLGELFEFIDAAPPAPLA